MGWEVGDLGCWFGFAVFFCGVGVCRGVFRKVDGRGIVIRSRKVFVRVRGFGWVWGFFFL